MSPEDKRVLMQILKSTPEFKPYEVVVAEEVINGHLRDPAGTGYNILIAEDDGEVAGYICYGETPCTVGTWDIYWIAVAQEMRGKGIGQLLTEAAEKAIKTARGRMAIIETSSTPQYENTRRFYEKRGYQTVARIADFYTPGDDKLILKKTL